MQIVLVVVVIAVFWAAINYLPRVPALILTLVARRHGWLATEKKTRPRREPGPQDDINLLFELWHANRAVPLSWLTERISELPLVERQIVEEAEMRQRWKAGDSVTARSYFDRHPDCLDPEWIWFSVDLIMLEYRLTRRKEGEKAEHRERFLERYPEFREPLLGAFAAEDEGDLLDDSRQYDPGDVIEGCYEVVTCIGEGGQGEVFLAKDTSANRLVALKACRPDRTFFSRREMVETVADEFIVAARLGHPSLCPISGVCFDEQNRPLLVMDYVDGPPLKTYIAGRTSPLTAIEKVRLVAGVASGLSHAHKSRVFHRDVKPGNILMRGKRVPVLCDFGSSALDVSVRTGTRGYIAPEMSQTSADEAIVRHLREAMAGHCSSTRQRDTEQDDRRILSGADQFSLGIVLWQLLTDKWSASAEELEALDLERPFADVVGDLQHAIDEELMAIAARAISRRPEDRFESMEAFYQALFDWLCLQGWRRSLRWMPGLLKKVAF